MPKDFTGTLCGVKYRFRFKTRDQFARAGYPGNLGLCEDPASVKGKRLPEIWILSSLKGRELLRVALHEAQHGCDFLRASEEFVDQSSRGLTDIVWKLGFRDELD